MRKNPSHKQRWGVSLLRDRWDPFPHRLWKSFFNNIWLRSLNWQCVRQDKWWPSSSLPLHPCCQLSRQSCSRSTLRRKGTWGPMGPACRAVSNVSVDCRAALFLYIQTQSRMLLTQGSTSSFAWLSWCLYSKSLHICFAHTARQQ